MDNILQQGLNLLLNKYNLYKIKYSEPILHKFLIDLELKTHTSFETIRWLKYQYEIKICNSDIEEIYLLTKCCSPYLNFAIEANCGWKFFTVNYILEKVFIRECYIHAIILYAKSKDDKFSRDAISFFSDNDNTKRYFEIL